MENTNKITGFILIDKVDELVIENGKLKVVHLRYQKIKPEPKKKSRLARLIYKEIRRQESLAEEYFQELEDEVSGEMHLKNVEKLKSVLEFID